MCLVKRRTSLFPPSLPPTDLMAPLGVLFFFPDNDDCRAALPVQLKSDNGMAARRKEGRKASSRRGGNTHVVEQIT